MTAMPGVEHAGTRTVHPKAGLPCRLFPRISRRSKGESNEA